MKSAVGGLSKVCIISRKGLDSLPGASDPAEAEMWGLDALPDESSSGLLMSPTC